MGAAKWIAGFLGWAAWGPIGGLIGYFIGKAVDNYIDMSRQLPPGDGGTYTGRQAGTRPGGGYQRSSGSRGYTAQE